MPIGTINGIRLNYTVTGKGPLVVMVMGTGSPGRVWQLHQVPAYLPRSPERAPGAVQGDQRGAVSPAG